ncbi:MAG: hypothetical protein C4527_14240, partial [Candidatus Omnitrophota bacterium]
MNDTTHRAIVDHHHFSSLSFPFLFAWIAFFISFLVCQTISSPLTDLVGGSPDWQEYSPGSAAEEGISKGVGNPKGPVALALDANENPAVAWSYQTYPQSFVYVMQWNGEQWMHLGCNPETHTDIVGQERDVDKIVLDPTDNQFIVSMDYYQNELRKFDGKSWNLWANGRVPDSIGYQFFTDIAFLPDHTPVAVYHRGIGPAFSHVCVQKFVNGSWEEFSSGSTAGSGISQSSEWGIIRPQLAPTSDGKIYVVWEQKNPDRYGVFAKQWNGSEWINLFAEATNRFGIAQMSAGISERAIVLDSNEHPIVTYHTGDPARIYVSRFDGEQWVEMGIGSASGDGLCASGRAGSNSIIVNNHNDHPVVIWQDTASGGLYAKQFNGVSWIEAGQGAASADGMVWGADFDAVMKSDGSVILAYADGENREIFVRKYVPPISSEQLLSSEVHVAAASVISIPPISGTPGSVLHIPVNLETTATITALTMDFSYDASKMSFQGIEKADTLIAGYVLADAHESTPGSIRFAAAPFTAPPITNSGILVYLVFRINTDASGTAFLSIDSLM